MTAMTGGARAPVRWHEARFRSWAAALGLALQLPTAAAADEAEPSNASCTRSASVLERISEHASLTYYGVYRGAPLSDLGSPVQPGADGAPDPNAPQSLESYITAGYRLDPDTMVGISTHSYFYPVGRPGGAGPSVELLDPSMVLSRARLVDRNGFTLKGLLSIALPLTPRDVLRKQNLALSVSPTFIASWDVPGTRLNLSAYGYLRAYIPTANALPDARSYELYVAPSASYRLSRTVAATLWVDLVQVTRTRGTGLVSGMHNALVDIEPGISWDITESLSINPMINLYPSNPTLSAASLQAFIVGRGF